MEEVGELGPVDGTAVGVDGENAAGVFGGLEGEVLIDEAGLVAGESALHVGGLVLPQSMKTGLLPQNGGRHASPCLSYPGGVNGAKANPNNWRGSQSHKEINFH